MAKIGVVADDLTGATTTGVLLARSKAKTAVFFDDAAAANYEGLSDLDAVLISSNSRPLPKKDAYQRVSKATAVLKNAGVKYFSKRIDTTLRGGIGTEIDAMLDTLGEDTVAMVVPAMPQSRRILVGGYSVIDNVALIKTPVAQDVRTPVRENYIPKLIQSQSKRKVDAIFLEDILAGEAKIAEVMQQKIADGAEILVIDAISIDDVEVIAKAAMTLGRPVLAVDPGPFTAKMAFCRGIIEVEQPNIPDVKPVSGKTVLIAAGSATPVTKRQMEVLCEDDQVRRIEVDPLALIHGADSANAEIARVAKLAVGMLRQPIPPKAILMETALHGDLLDLDAEDKRHGYAKGMSAESINGGLGTIVAAVIEEAGRDKIAGLYATGGDTMVNVCYHLGVNCLEMIDYVIPQTDVSFLTGKYAGLPIVGKGGLTGDDHIAEKIIGRLCLEAARYR
ncbi:four-carbon acid sugar kinase family protein [Pseudoramibacter sp.]|jgi:uncharacterized protein YgbK (DUF1537 family)|uniref:four-carbon acid sugar kinase family protein n=1 Tax=Pseudoramibacter sp. TaxID=2034862 RepID=UPI0025F3FA42|nr:four-carbon acid sugar kinase family protein [Pseudoramibacter sp.]MCH4072497.1 four-carbon acid sugar kinase family protein [Pseudoramibacter sp.]MCH4106268.1 four-carbon acid sugar kinase family protein [Pseudoramibacter sp.]